MRLTTKHCNQRKSLKGAACDLLSRTRINDAQKSLSKVKPMKQLQAWFDKQHSSGDCTVQIPSGIIADWEMDSIMLSETYMQLVSLYGGCQKGMKESIICDLISFSMVHLHVSTADPNGISIPYMIRNVPLQRINTNCLVLNPRWSMCSLWNRKIKGQKMTCFMKGRWGPPADRTQKSSKVDRDVVVLWSIMWLQQ